MSIRDLFKRAQRLFVEGKHSECIDAFTESIAAGEREELSFLSRGVAYLTTGQFQLAISDFDEVIRRDEGNTRAHFYRGVAHMVREDFDAAITDFDRTIQLEPLHGSALLARGTAHARLGNELQAVRDLKTAISLSRPSHTDLSDTAGIFREQFDKALDIIKGNGHTPETRLTEQEITVLKRWLE